MAKSQEVKIGPWPRGVNLIDPADQIGNDEATWILNFDVDNTGVLTSRRSLDFSSAGTSASTKYLLGSAILDGETQTRVFVGVVGAAQTEFYALDNPRAASDIAVAPTKLNNNLNGTYKSIVHYQNKFWYIPGVASSVGNSSPAALANTLTAVAAIPWGDYGFVLKDRMFVIRKSTSELYFSKATDFALWTAPDGGVIKVSPGDNKPITKVVVLNSQIVIFKQDETYILSFTNSPTGDGVLRQVSPDQGALDAITYNNEIYCFNSRSVFKFVNGFFQDIGTQLNLYDIAQFDRNMQNTGRIHIVGNTLIVGCTATTAVAMNLNTGAWSSYEVHPQFSNVFSSSSVTGRGSTQGRFVVFGDGRTELHTMYVERTISAGKPDHASDNLPRAMKYEFFSKVYDLEDSMRWKRLYGWFADIYFPTISVFGRVGFLIDDRIPSLTRRPDGEKLINSAGGLVGPTVSARFKTLQFCYVAATPAVTAANRVVLGPTVRYIKAKIGVKANVSKGVSSV